jgi:hypothetical protein
VLYPPVSEDVFDGDSLVDLALLGFGPDPRAAVERPGL